MKKKLLITLLYGISFLEITGCVNVKDKNNEEEKYMIGHTFDDGRIIHFTFDVQYGDDSLSDAFANNKLSLNDFINKLDYVDTLKDGGSKLYKYNKNNKEFGNKEFYTIVCDSLDGVKDIYVSRYKENLNDKCTLKIDDLEDVSMTIKDGTLTNVSATIIITDTSNRNNIYGEEYRIEKKDSGEWVKLNTIIDNYAWNLIGYSVNENNTLEFKINWEWLYGKLEEGTYRIVKHTSEAGEEPTHYITVEFVIE